MMRKDKLTSVAIIEGQFCKKCGNSLPSKSLKIKESEGGKYTAYFICPACGEKNSARIEKRGINNRRTRTEQITILTTIQVFRELNKKSLWKLLQKREGKKEKRLKD